MGTVKELVLRTNDEAAAVVDRLREVLKNYGFVTRGDLNDLVGLPSTFPDEKWGWTNLDDLAVTQNRDGLYVITMPEETEDTHKGWTPPRLPPKPPTMDELIKLKASELQNIYNNRTAGTKTFEGFLYDFTLSAMASVTTELLAEFLSKKKS